MLAGVNGTDPFVLMPLLLTELKAMGFSGVQNFPTIGLFDGNMRQSFEETGMGFGLEVDMIAEAHELDMLTTPYVFNPGEARRMTKAGADIIVAHMGVTTGGAIGARRRRRSTTASSRSTQCRRRALGAQGCHPALPWRADLDARGRPYILDRAKACTASTARARWSGCRRKPQLPGRRRFQGRTLKTEEKEGMRK